jgi:hypothetical protein
MKMTIPNIELMKPQIEFLFNDKVRFLGLMGSYRSGKTFVACLKAIHLASLNIGYNGLMLEPTASMLAGVLIPTMEEVLSLLGWADKKTPGKCWFEIRSSATNARVELHFLEGDVVIYLRSSENWNRIRGFSVAWFIADEFDTSGYDLCKEAWQKMVSRLTSGNVMQGCVTSTKEGFQWAYKFFVEQAGADREMIDIYVDDNPFIDDGYIEMMRQQLTAKQFAAYIGNEFINFAEGNVYYAYDRVHNRSTETIAKHPNAPLSIGIDFNVGKMATTVGIIIGQIPHIVDEIYGCQNTEHLIREIKRRYPNRAIKCFVDGSGDIQRSDFTTMSKTDVMALKSAFGNDNVHHYKGHIPIADRVGAVNLKFCNSLNSRTLFINDVTCPRLTACIEQQGYIDGKPDKAGDIDHHPDALGYFISYVWAPTKHAAKITVLR